MLDFVKVIEERGYKYASFDGISKQLSNHTYLGATDTIESPSTALWLYLLVAQHYDRVGQTTLALKYADKALVHTPTLIETLMIKAKIFKVLIKFTFFNNCFSMRVTILKLLE